MFEAVLMLALAQPPKPVEKPGPAPEKIPAPKDPGRPSCPECGKGQPPQRQVERGGRRFLRQREGGRLFRGGLFQRCRGGCR